MSFADHAHGLWHLDFHMGSLAVLGADGEWRRPHLLGILDDHSRLCCHLQWYLHEDAESLVHGLSGAAIRQAMLRRGLPHALLSDNGSAMEAGETKSGLLRLGVLHEQTLPYSPYQNGKQEVFWGQVEGRLLAMLEGLAEPTIAGLNRSTLVWVELEYNRKPHRETHEPPLERLLKARSLERPCPSPEELRRAFTVRRERKVRGSDGTISLEGKRYEVPNVFRNLRRVVVRYARWDLGRVFLVDPETEVVLAPLLPLDKARNADEVRRNLKPPGEGVETETRAPAGPAPLLAKLLADYGALGLSLPYLPKDKDKAFGAPPARDGSGS